MAAMGCSSTVQDNDEMVSEEIKVQDKKEKVCEEIKVQDKDEMVFEAKVPGGGVKIKSHKALMIIGCAMFGLAAIGLGAFILPKVLQYETTKLLISAGAIGMKLVKSPGSAKSKTRETETSETFEEMSAMSA